MPGELSMLRAFWVVVVRPDRTDLLARMQRLLDGAPWVQVVLDRRRGDRRRPVVPPPRVAPERRRGERRQPAAGATEARYRLIQRGEGYQVLQSQGRAAARCPECSAAVEFDMPRLSELPVQLEVEVLHQGRSASALHVVETRARRASGRPFLACRMVARRRAAAG
jgi:hypothetical protein